MAQEDRTEITDEIRAKLIDESKRTGLGARALLADFEETAPADLTAGMLDHVLHGHTRSIRTAHLAWLLDSFLRADPRIPLTSAMRDKLKQEKDRTGVSPYRLLTSFAFDPPKGLNRRNIEAWLDCNFKTVRRRHYKWVVAAYEGLPDCTRIAMSDEHLAMLRSEIARTGKGSKAILRGKRRQMPEGLNSGIIDQWLNGNVQSASEQHWNWVRQTYAEDQPDPDSLELTKEMRNHLKAERKRTGAGIQKLFRGTNDLRPEGLTSSSIVHNWLSGSHKTVRKDHLEWVIEAYKNFGTPKAQSSRLIITEELRDQLVAEFKRTGLGAASLMGHARNSAPASLNPTKIQTWLSGTTKTANREEWNFVMEFYAKFDSRR